MNKYGALVERHWQRKAKYSENNLSQRHFDHHKFHVDWLGTESGLRGERPATNHWISIQWFSCC